MIESKIVYFSRSNEEATEMTLKLAHQRAEELGIKTMIVASTTGKTAVQATEVCRASKIIAVSHVMGMQEPNVLDFTDKNRELVEAAGGKVLTAAHAFSGLSAAMRLKYHTYSLGDIVANSLRVLGQGIKVCCEITMMAADAGLIRTDEDIISVGGSASGADTALVLTPALSRHFFDLKVKEILCKTHM